MTSSDLEASNNSNSSNSPDQEVARIMVQDTLRWLERAVIGLNLCPFAKAVYVKDQLDLFARICAYFERHHFSIWDARIHTTKHGYALDTFQISGSHLVDEGGSYRDLIQLVEYELAESIKKSAPLPEPNMGRLSRQSKSFPIQARVSLQPDERNQYFALTLSAADRSGLLYAVAKALAKYQISLHTARINTLGERVEDIMLLDGSNLSKNPKLQIQLETELLEVLAA